MNWRSRPGVPALLAAIRAAPGHVADPSPGPSSPGRAARSGSPAATGAVVDLRWREIAGGVLVAGAAQEVTVTGLQVVHAALRRRKPLIVIDPSADPAVAGALSGGLRGHRNQVAARRAADGLGRVVRERSAALLRVGSPEVAERACAAVGALAADLRRIGVDGDGLIWIPGCDSLPAAALVPLISGGARRAAGAADHDIGRLAARELAGLVGVVLVHRLADPAGGRRPSRPGRPGGHETAARAALAWAGRVHAGSERAATSAGGTRAAGAGPASPRCAAAGAQVAEVAP